MTTRIHIDRLVIDHGLLGPNDIVDFRAALTSELAQLLVPGAPVQRSPTQRAPCAQATRLAGQVAGTIGKWVVRP